jgi:hypothetical protein
LKKERMWPCLELESGAVPDCSSAVVFRKWDSASNFLDEADDKCAS